MKSPKILFVFLAGVLGMNACTSSRPVVANVPETVSGMTTIHVQEQTVPDFLQAVGTVRASRTAQLSAEITGRVTAINVREGDAVRQGEVLAAIEDLQPQAGYEQAQAALTAANHEVAAAESERVLAQATFSRLKTLYEKKSISAHEFDEINARAQSTAARYDAAVAARAQAAAGLQQARVVLDRARIRAPFDGTIIERRVDPGTLAVPGLPLLAMESNGHYRLEANVNERGIRYVHIGAMVPVSLDSFDGKPLSGKVAQIVPAADPFSHSFVVKVELPSNVNLRSGLYGHMKIAQGAKRAIVIPRRAVLEHGQIQIVYAVGEDHIATLRYVTLGMERAEGVEVLSGLGAGDRIVADAGGRDLSGKRIEAGQ